jgi:site-specific DNA recombinase
MLSNDPYVGRVHWRGQSFPGLHEALIDTEVFERTRAILKERGEDWSLRASERGEFLLTGLLRCGRCRRAYVGMSARGNGGTYRYYACSGRQKLGRRGCDGERLPQEKLEAVVLDQLTGMYRDGTVIRGAIEQAAASNEPNHAALAERRTSLAKEMARQERAVERYQEAFEAGDLDPARFNERLSALDARLDALHDQDQALAGKLAAEASATPDAAALPAVADRLPETIAGGDADPAKALLRILIAGVRVNGRHEIVPTYRVPPAVGCAQGSSVGDAGLEPATSALSRRRSPS